MNVRYHTRWTFFTRSGPFCDRTISLLTDHRISSRPTRAKYRHVRTKKDFGSQFDVFVLEQKDHCWMEVPPLVVLFPGTLADVPALHVHPVQLRHRPPRKHRKRLMQDKRSAVKGLAMKEATGRTKTLLRWCHSEANVCDALAKLDNRAHELLRKFLQSKVWRMV